jgi:cytochrome c551/c552
MKNIYFSVISIICLMVSTSIMAADMPELAKKNNYCSVCHKVDAKSIGPSWLDISKFYNGKTERSTSGKTVQEATGGLPVDQFLIKKVSVGGHGNWGAQPMLANDNVYNQPSEAKQQDIKELVAYILSLAK